MSLLAAVRQEAKALWGGGKGQSLVVLASGWGLLLGTRMIFPVLLPDLRSAFDLTLTVAGLLVTILWLGIALGQLPSGILADRYSERSVLAGGTFVAAIALVVLVTAFTPLLLFLATGLIGLGLSLYPIARITLLSDIYPERIGSALGVTMATGDLGQTVIPPIAGLVAAAMTWQMGFGFMIPLLVLSGVVLWLVLPAQTSTESAVDSLSVESVRYVFTELRRSNLVFVAFLLFLYLLVWQSFSGFYPTYLIEQKGFSPSVTGLLFSLFFAFGVVVKPVSGSAYDRIGMRNALVLVLVGPTVGLAILPFVDGFWLIVGVTALVSTMLGTGAITQSFLSDSFSDDMRGTGLGVVRTTVATLSALGPVAFGGIADRGYFDEGYLLLAAVMLAVIVLTLRLPPDYGSSIDG